MKQIAIRVMGIMLMARVCPAQTVQSTTPAHIVVGGGVSGVAGDRRSIIGMVEFQPAFHAGPFGAWVGVQASDQEYYLGAGLLLDWHVTEHIFITPGFGAGIYGEHRGFDLGSTLEFRSGIECGYDMKKSGRLSIGVWHLSNARLGDVNPGTEVVALRYALPLSTF